MMSSSTGTGRSVQPTGSPTTGSATCPCGCAECESTCCSLDCLVQPRFFHGQLLSDRDLNALLTWTQNKQRLVRYRDGWGVACGLELWCDPTHPGQILVGTGYALTCCGDDVVVCNETSFDLKRPCCGGRDPDCGCGTGRRDKKDDVGSGTHAFDIFVKYVEQPSDPQPALRRGYSCDAGTCDFGRTRETFELVCLPAQDDDPALSRARRWAAGYEACQEVLLRFPTSLYARDGDSETDRGEAVRRWLLHWIDDHPLRQFCWVRDEICEVVDAAELAREERILRWLFLIVQDCRLAYLSGCDCGSCGCDDQSGVPLGRVWVETTDGPGKSTCRIVCIDSDPPFRRELSKDCWPAADGDQNLGRLVWRREAQVDSELASTWVRPGSHLRFEPDSYGTVEGLRRELADGQLIVGAGDLVRPRIWDSEGYCGGGRLVDFVPSRDGPTKPPVVEPPIVEPPIVEPPVVEPPLVEPPVVEPPVVEPPIEPPVEPPIVRPPIVRPPRPPIDGPRPPRPGPDPGPEPIVPDLTVIDGIGDVTAGMLRAEGIHDVQALADASVRRLVEIVPRINRATATTWKEQARALLR
jgi:hypothetical protein